MKKFCVALIALSVFVLSGCGGGGSSSTGDGSQVSTSVKQVIVLNSPALERNKRYRIYKGVKLSGMNGYKYYVSNTGSEATQSVLNLGFSEVISSDEAFIVVNYAPDYETHSGSVVFAYDPSGVKDEFTSGGSITYSDGKLMRYRTLDFTEDTNTSDVAAPAASTYKEYESERGTTKFTMGSGISIEPDEESYLPRDVPSAGNVFQLVRKVNTFSGIVSGY